MHLRFSQFFSALFFAQIFWDQIWRPVSSEPYELDAQNLEYFCCIVVLQNALEIWFTDIGVGAAEPRKIGKKIEISKFLPSLAVSGGKYFSDFGSGLVF